MQVDPSGESMSAMEVEFKKLTSIQQGQGNQQQDNPEKFLSANLPCNKFKNRLVNILPYESSRVCLQPIRGRGASFFFFFWLTTSHSQC